MAFPIFQYLPPEVRDGIWKEKLYDEIAERLFIVNHETFRILPTKNNISPLLAVNVEARCAARRFYNRCLPVFRLPSPSPPNLMNCGEWLLHTSEVRWGKGVGPQGQSWTNRERYWYHYAFMAYGRAAEALIRGRSTYEDEDEDEDWQPRGCIYLNEATDRFMLSWDVYTRSKAEVLVHAGGALRDGALVLDPRIDICAYQMILGKKAEILRQDSRQEPYEIPRNCLSCVIPEPVLQNIRQVVFCDVKDDGSYNVPSRYQSLGDLRGPRPCPYEYEVAEYWRSDQFAALAEKPSTVLYLVLPDSDSGPLVGKIETHTARALNIVELHVKEITPEESDNDSDQSYPSSVMGGFQDW